MDYIEKEKSFHDYRIGNIHYLENEGDLTIEEVISGAKIQDIHTTYTFIDRKQFIIKQFATIICTFHIVILLRFTSEKRRL